MEAWTTAATAAAAAAAQSGSQQMQPSSAITRREVDELIRQVRGNSLYNRQLSSICQVNGLKSTGVKAELQSRIIDRKFIHPVITNLLSSQAAWSSFSPPSHNANYRNLGCYCVDHQCCPVPLCTLLTLIRHQQLFRKHTCQMIPRASIKFAIV